MAARYSYTVKVLNDKLLIGEQKFTNKKNVTKFFRAIKNNHHREKLMRNKKGELSIEIETVKI